MFFVYLLFVFLQLDNKLHQSKESYIYKVVGRY